MPNNPNNPTWIEPPPPRQDGLGCFAKGCLVTIAALCTIFGLLVVGGFFTARYVRHAYLSTKPLAIPVAPATPEEVQTLRQQWSDFKEVASRNENLPPAQRQPAHLEYTAGQINEMIAGSKARGHVSVGIANGVMSVQFSLSAADLSRGHVNLPMVSDRYLNGTLTIQTAGPTTPSAVVISNPKLNGRSVPTSLFDTSYRGRSLRDYVESYSGENAIGTFQLVGDKVVFDSPGPQ